MVGQETLASALTKYDNAQLLTVEMLKEMWLTLLLGETLLCTAGHDWLIKLLMKNLYLGIK